jgi:hypothetical protein
MKRLRHPINTIREPFGTAGLIVAMIALVAALGGSALAAKGALTGKQKKEVEKIAKKVSKPGPAGPQGSAGPSGKDGANGTNGTNGSPGTAGKSVVASAASGTECTGGVGGTKFEVEGSGTSSHVCNGKTGFTKTLPSGETEKGSWSAFGPTAKVPVLGVQGLATTVSFNIPLAVAPTPHIVTFGEGETPVCPGGVEEPEAEPGNLCLFIREEKNVLAELIFPPENGVDFTKEGQAGKVGALIFAGLTGSEDELNINGTWAVTAE